MSRAFGKFHQSLKKRPGIDLQICPYCGKTVKEREVEIDGLNKWAFQDGVSTTMDARGCDCEWEKYARTHYYSYVEKKWIEK